MPTSTSRLSYSDCFDYFDQALSDPLGLALGFEYSGDARQFRLRMNAARALDREENALAYATNPDHPLFGRSMYDELQLKLRQAFGKTYVVIERNGVRVLEAIPLSEMTEKLEPLQEQVEWKRPAEVLKLTDRRV